MALAQPYHKVILTIIFIGSCFFLEKTYAVTLNFSAKLVNGTCEVSLNKSTLPLGDVSKAELRPAQLVRVQPFTLSIYNCVGTSGTSSNTPYIFINGAGNYQDSKWLFRTPSSANGVGIMVIKSDVIPEYNQTESKMGTLIKLAEVGQTPIDQSFTFYAGVSCGGVSGCSAIGTGDVSAIVNFVFVYQ